MKILITGKGFIGSKLKGDFWEKKEGNNILNISKIKNEYDLVIHTATSFSNNIFEDNILGTIAVVNQCKKWGAKLIFLSSAAVYGNNNNARENSKLKPVNLYGVSKQFGEWYVQRELKNYVILRLSNVYGKGGKGVISQWLEKGSSNINGDGEQSRDFVYINDVIKAINKAKDWQGIYNLSTNKGTKINDLYGEIRYSKLNNKKALTKGFKPISVREGIYDFYNR